ncbi:MAG: LTA synthase family protein [Desulfobacterales bacterium]|nr:LTA synthase family protein [Desulfobacterales bacterium]
MVFFSKSGRAFSPSWRRFFIELQKDFKLLGLLILTLQLYRIFVCLTFRSSIADDLGAMDFSLAWFSGFRFDARVSMFTLFPSLIITIFCGFFALKGFSEWVRQWTGRIVLLLNCIVFGINYIFIVEYKDNFNQWIFGAVYDDFWAVLQSAWSTYPVVRIVFVVSLLFWWLQKLAQKVQSAPFISGTFFENISGSLFKKVSSTLVILILMTFSARGSVGHRPVQLKDAAVTTDSFLNRMVLNPWSALRYAIKHHRVVSNINTGIENYIPGGDVDGAVQVLTGRSSTHNLDRDFTRKAQGLTQNRPTHIFFVVMESMDSWPLLDKYQALNLMPEMKRLSQEGLWVPAFLSAAGGTMGSMGAIISGIPEVGVITNYQASSRKPFGTSIAPQFRALGYETNLFYGGYLSWQRLEEYALNQGFDRCYGGNHMGEWLKGNEWGVDDEALFDFVTKTLKKETPTFNLILSTSNHPPYDLNVFKMGFPHEKIPESLQADYDGKVPMEVFGHLWYSDREVGRFVREAEEKFPQAVFAITGDHWSRKFINEKPTFYESHGVPFVLYGKKVLEGLSFPRKVAGSHLNIIPTLMELAAPKGHPYVSLDESLFSKERLPVGLGRGIAITPSYIISGGTIERLPFGPEDTEPDISSIHGLIGSWRGIGWWRIMKGASTERDHESMAGMKRKPSKG